MVKSACGIEAVYMCFNGTGIWGGETLYEAVSCAGFDYVIILRVDVCLSRSREILLST